MYKKLTHLFLTTSLFITPFHSQQLHARHYSSEESTSDKIIKGTAIGAAVGAVATGAYMLGSWLFSPSNEKFVHQSHQNLDELEHHYGPIMDALAPMATNRSHKHQPTQLSEEKLTALADTFFRNGTLKISDYLYTLNNAINNMQSQSKDLHKRMRKSNIERGLYRDMEQLADRIAMAKTELEQLYDILKKDESFFALYDVESLLHRGYKQELEIIGAANAHRYERTQRTLHATVIAGTSYNEHQGLTYKNYLYALENDIAELHKRLSRVSSHHRTIIAHCTLLYDQLRTLKHTILTSSEYIQADRDYTIYLQKEALLRIEREKTAALERQNSILREQNRLKEQELREAQRREKAEIIIELNCNHDDSRRYSDY
ncbi:MAG TPA: hypothetical protein VGT41_01480 [Candidatus Babeliales bacterium]|nr:hypothetical protein [Candidatus Babeliales bacterium]